MIRLVPMLAETPIDSCRSGESLKESASTVAAPSVVAAVSTHEQAVCERHQLSPQFVDADRGGPGYQLMCIWCGEIKGGVEGIDAMILKERVRSETETK